MDVQFPSTEFPGLPSFRLTMPAGWVTVESPGPGVLVALMAEGPPGAFKANVVVTSRRHTAPVELSTLATGVHDRLLELPEAVLISEKEVPVGHLASRLARVSYRHPSAGTLVQAVLTVPVQHGSVVDVLDVVGTAAADRIDDDFNDVDQVMQSLGITG